MSKRFRAKTPSVPIDTGPPIRGAVLAADGTTIRSATAVAAEWIDPDDDGRGRTPRVVRGMRAACPLITIHQRGGLVTSGHLKAVTRFQDDWEIGVGAQTGERRAVGGGGSPADSYAEDRRLDAVARTTAALRAIGGRGALIVLHVVLGEPDRERRDVAAFASRHRLNVQVAMGMLISALDRLEEYYFPPTTGKY